MAQKFNTELITDTKSQAVRPWEKIKTLKGFLEGRLSAMALEEVGKLKHQAKLAN